MDAHILRPAFARYLKTTFQNDLALARFLPLLPSEALALLGRRHGDCSTSPSNASLGAC
ncbi:MAG: hypothetical protein ACRDGS_15805 [Chloroflexota bacterium]